MCGHPTGRLLLSRKGYEADWTRCFEVMSKNKVILELNCNPQRLDADWRWGKMVEENKLMISINPDAHSIRGIADLQYGYWMAEKMMIPFHQILNLKNADEVEEYLEKRKT